jgi:hypothetical protein
MGGASARDRRPFPQATFRDGFWLLSISFMMGHQTSSHLTPIAIAPITSTLFG